MGLTDKQLADRVNGIGASSVPAILGVDPWRSAYDEWLILTGKVEPPEAGEAAEIGTLVEPAIFTLTERRTGRKVLRPTATFVADNGVMRANVDAMLDKAVRGADIVEAKSTGIAEGWGEPGGDDIPERVLVQVHAQFVCAGSTFAHVARLLGRYGFKFDLYDVEHNERLAEIIEQRVCDFWHKNVLADVPPPDSCPSLELAKAMKRTPGKTITWRVPELGHYVGWHYAKIAADNAGAEEERRKAVLLAALGDAEAVQGAEGNPLLTYFKDRDSEKLDAKRLKTEQPELYARYVKKVPGSRKLMDKAPKAKE